ncbi:hypothetical protein MP631_22005 [Xanthomonas phaseoli pv. phaseoli]|nr:hypothetical protein MP631_22005 [Xanthomonas phaseoli pv. phaseoli]
MQLLLRYDCSPPSRSAAQWRVRHAAATSTNIGITLIGPSVATGERWRAVAAVLCATAAQRCP